MFAFTQLQQVLSEFAPDSHSVPVTRSIMFPINRKFLRLPDLE